MMFYLSFIANIASLVGLGLSIWLLLEVKKIKKKILFNATLNNKIKKLKSIIKKLMPDTDDTQRIESSGICISILQELFEVNQYTKEEIDIVIDLLHKDNLTDKDKKTLYKKLNLIHESLKQSSENLKLGGQ